MVEFFFFSLLEEGSSSSIIQFPKEVCELKIGGGGQRKWDGRGGETDQPGHFYS